MGVVYLFYIQVHFLNNLQQSLLKHPVAIVLI